MQVSGFVGSTAILLLFRGLGDIGGRPRVAAASVLTALCLVGQLLVLLLRPTPWLKVDR